MLRKMDESLVKTYWVRSPEGEETRLKYLKSFCLERGLDMSTMLKVSKGKITNHKGWICRLVEDGNIVQPIEEPITKTKLWVIVDPDGTIYDDVENLKQFCAEHGLSYGAMKDIGKGTRRTVYQGWAIAPKTPDYSGKRTALNAERDRLEQVAREEYLAAQEAKKLIVAGELRACVEFPNDLHVANGFSYIYKLKNLVNGKQYIGVSYDPRERFAFHKRPSNKEPIGRAIQKYGEHAFDKEIVLQAPTEMCFSLEDHFIGVFNSDIHTGHGYNTSRGGRGTKAGTVFGSEARANMKAAAQARKSRGPHNEETKAKISAAQKGIPRSKHSEETIQKIRENGNLGKKFSDEHKARIAEARNKRIMPKASDETKAKMSAAHRGKKLAALTIEKLRIFRHSEETKQRISETKRNKKPG